MDELLNFSLGVIITGILLAILVFILLREFWCWYYKVNQKMKNQEEIIDLLKKQNTLLESINTRIIKDEHKKIIDLNV